MLGLWMLLCCGLFTSDVLGDCQNSQPKSTAARLKNDLFCGYDASVRSTKQYNDTVEVSIFLWLKFIEFEEHYNILSVCSWTVWIWKDAHLTWTPSQYDGLQELRIESDVIWVPDVALYTMGYMGGVQNKMPSTTCILNSTGGILCVPPTTYYAFCKADLRQWPFDEQDCSMDLGSWSHTANFVNLTMQGKGVTTSDYEQDRVWELLSVTADRHESHFGNDTFPYLRYMFKLKRHSGEHAASVVVPSLILSVLTLVTFWLDPGCSERFTIGCMNILAHCLYLQYLGAVLPANGDTAPLIVVFFRDSMLLAGMSLVVAVVAQRMTSSARTPPVWLTSSTGWVIGSRPGKIIMLEEEDQQDDAPTTEEGAELVAPAPDAPAKVWRRIATLLDRLFFLIFTLTFFILLLAFVP